MTTTPIKKQWAKNLSEAEQYALFVARNERDRERARESARKNKVRTAARKYKITEEELRAMIQKAGGVCELCSSPLGDVLNIDHCHDSLKVRGILCGKCNNGLGQFNDSPAVLRKAAQYLERHS